MKKIRLFLALIFAFVSFSPVCAQTEEIIPLKREETAPFSDTVLDEEENDDDPVNGTDDSSIYKEKSKPTFINAPKDNNSQPVEKFDAANPLYSPRFLLFNVLSNAAKDVYNLEIERTDVPSALLKDYLTFKTEKGPLQSIHIWGAMQSNFSTTFTENSDTDSEYNTELINVLIDGKFKGGKENFRIMLDPTPRNGNVPYMGRFFQDLYVETHRIPHTSVLIGNSRPGVGIEGAQSPYTLSFIHRSQIARNLSNMRKFGLRVRGNYSLMDYDAGLYSSSTNFTSFFPGHELDLWMNLKPLGKTDGRYGKLVTGAGFQSGEKHDMSYNLSAAYLGYEYKKFWTKLEYAYANGSNGGSGLTDKHSQGFFATIGYRITKKLELLARYDQFDPDRNIANNNRREYTLGTNYYLKGQALKLILNYIYCQNDSQPDSHRLMVGTQILL